MTKLMLLGLVTMGLVLTGPTGAEAKGKSTTNRAKPTGKVAQASGSRAPKSKAKSAARKVGDKKKAATPSTKKRSAAKVNASLTTATLRGFLSGGECDRDCGDANSSCAGVGNLCSSECRRCLADLTRGGLLTTK